MKEYLLSDKCADLANYNDRGGLKPEYYNYEMIFNFLSFLTNF